MIGTVAVYALIGLVYVSQARLLWRYRDTIAHARWVMATAYRYGISEREVRRLEYAMQGAERMRRIRQQRR